jgi:class 3 adenylate cyclase
VTILIADIVDFTQLSAGMTPKSLVFLLNGLFSLFDRLAEKYGLEKIKTSGDSYMVVGGLPTPRSDHVEAVAEMALDMRDEMGMYESNGERPLCVRIGVHTGQVVAGVIGTKKFSYDLWGDSVNTADRMQSNGIGGQIQVSTPTYERLRGKYLFDERGVIPVKGKGEMATYMLVGRL